MVFLSCRSRRAAELQARYDLEVQLVVQPILVEPHLQAVPFRRNLQLQMLGQRVAVVGVT